MRILIVDDSSFILKIQEAIVKKLTPDVVTCLSGLEAIDLIKTDAAFDLILMDMQMPEMNGCQTAQVIRGFNSQILIFALTGNESDEDEENSINSGMNAVLHKPLNLNELNLLIQQFFRPIK